MVNKILPSHRDRKRYIVFDIAENECTADEAKSAILNACQRYIGEFGCQRANIQFINVYTQNRGIIRITHTELNDIKACLPLITSINQKKVTVRVIGVSGILKKAKTRFLEKR